MLSSSIIVFSIFFLWINSKPFGQGIEQEILEESFWYAKAHHEKTYDYVIIGDSRALRGINPSEFELGKKTVFNFSFRSATLNLDYLRAAQRLLKTKESIILIALTPHSIVNLDKQNEHFYQYSKVSMDTVFLRKHYFINKLLSPIKERKFDLKRKSHFTKKFYENGFVSTNTDKPNIQKGLDLYKDKFEKVDPDYKMVKDILNYAQIENLQLTFFRMPSCMQMENIENQYGPFAVTTLISLVNKFRQKWITIKDEFSYTTYDGSHLVPESAQRFSKKLGKQLEN